MEGHTGFRWLKGPAAVAPVFLKSPQRIRAMGLVLILALVVRNYIQGKLRAELAAQQATLPHPFTKKADSKPTTEMTFEHFSGLLTQVVTFGEESRRLPMKLSAPAEKVLKLFGLDLTVFSPRERTLRGGPSPTPGM